MLTDTPLNNPRTVEQDESLLKVATVLETVVKESDFDFSSWAGFKYNGAKTALGCGTTACALGWATVIPELGLELRKAAFDTAAVALVGSPEPVLGSDNNAWDISIASAMKVFGLTKTEAVWLFSPAVDDEDDEYEPEDWGSTGKPSPTAGPKVVAQHIRNFVAAGGIPS